MAPPAPASALRTTLASLGLHHAVLASVELPLGSLVWLEVGPAAHDLGPPDLVGELRIAETGVVARLEVQNPSKVDVLLPSDLVVDGGKQARVVERSVIVPAGGAVSVPVRCVEAGRWHPQAGADATRFAVTASASIASREHLAKLKQHALRTRRTYELEQGAVWSHVEGELQRTRVSSATNSYAAYLSSREARVARAKRMELAPPPRANAVAVLRHAGGASFVEALPSPEHLARAVVDLAADLLDEGGAAQPRRPFAEPKARARVVMDAILAAAVVVVPSPPGTTGDALAVDADRVAGFVLAKAGRLAHLTATVDA